MSKSELGVSLEKSKDLGITFLNDSREWSWGAAVPLDKCVLHVPQSPPCPRHHLDAEAKTDKYIICHQMIGLERELGQSKGLENVGRGCHVIWEDGAYP